MNKFYFDISKLSEYREDNCLEVKKATKGLPDSIWETYSSFANSEGGLIVLVVEEDKNHQLHITGVNNPDELVRDFWNTINNQQKISLNILTDKMVSVQTVEDKQIVVIEVPRAEREMRPVYVGTDPIKGTYRRNHEGDFHCTREEVSAFFRDADPVSVDMRVLTEMDLSVFDLDTIRDYRNRFINLHQNHPWANLEDELFLRKIGAVGVSLDDNKIHPTIAGLLMFGYEYEIIREFPGYFLDYQERFDESIRWTHRTISSSGDWSGNLFDFYFRVIYRLSSDLNIPFVLNGITRVDNTELHVALREALLNTLVHADYYGRQGTVIIRTPQMITFSNPGDMRISLRAAVGGGVSDPRNSVLMKMFSLIGVGERAGMGIPGLLDIWQRLTGIAPIYASQFSPNRVTVSMQIKTIGDKSVINGSFGDKSAINSIIGDKSAIKGGNSDKESSSVEQKLCMIIEYMQTHQNVTVADITQLLAIKSSRSRDYLRMLVDRGVVVTNGANKNRTYTLNVK